MSSPEEPTLWEAFYAEVHQVPAGEVRSYGEIARAAGYPRHARHVGYALHSLPPGSSVPWHRIVNAKGEISQRANAALQRQLLEAEGVRFDLRGRVARDQRGSSPG